MIFDDIVTVNTMIRGMHDGENIFFLDMFHQFRTDVWAVIENLIHFFFKFIFTVVDVDLFIEGLHVTAAGQMSCHFGQMS